MKTHARFKDGVLLIRSSRSLVWIMTIAGIILGITGIYTLVNSIFPGHLFFSTGIILTSMGLFSFVNSRYYKIYLNDDKGNINILESTFKSITSFTLPVERYSMVSVQTRLRARGSKKIEQFYDVVLMNEFGSSLFLTEFDNREEAVSFANNVKDCCNKDLQIDNPPLIKNVKLKDIENLQLPDERYPRTHLKERLHGKDQTLKWKNSFSYLHILYISTIFYGLFHMHHFFISTRSLPETIKKYLYIIIIGFYISALMYMIIKNAITCITTITPNEISYYRHFLNKWIGFIEIRRDKGVLVKNSLNMYNNSIEVLSSQTQSHMDKLKETLKTNTTGDDRPHMQLLRYISNKTIKMNTHNLTISEKFYIEDMLLKK